MSPRPSIVLIYTFLRILLFVATWMLLELLTPLRGIWSLVVALLISGVISFFVLNHQRRAMSQVVAGFFGRINARIDASARAEDVDDDDFTHEAADRSQNDPQAER